MRTNSRAFRGYFLEQGPSTFQADATKREQELEKQIAMLEQLLGKKNWRSSFKKNPCIFPPPRADNLPSKRERW